VCSILILVPCIFYYFVQWTNNCTINWQFIILLVHVSTLFCYPQGAHQYLLSYINMSMQHSKITVNKTLSVNAVLVIQFKVSHVFCCWISMYNIIKFIKILLVTSYNQMAKIILLLQFLGSPVCWPYIQSVCWCWHCSTHTRTQDIWADTTTASTYRLYIRPLYRTLCRTYVLHKSHMVSVSQVGFH
jgi:hypothetical protein